jgi:hypothetical protein
LIFVPSSNLIMLIWFVNRLMFALLIGLPYPHKAPVALHFEVSSYSPAYLLKRRSFFIWTCRFSRVPVVMLMSSAYPWSSYVIYVPVGVWCWCEGLYPLLSMESHRRSGSMNKVNRKGESVSPCSVPLWMGMVGVLPCGVI